MAAISTSPQDLAPEPVPPLPEPRGPSRAILMLVNPRRLFLHWVRDPTLDAALGKAAGPALLLLEASTDGRRFEESARFEFDFRAPGWYLANPRPDCLVRVRLGLMEGAGFRELLVTNVVRVPRETGGSAALRWADRVPVRPAPASGPSGEGLWASFPGTRRDAPDAIAGGAGAVAFVLHAHLPFVRHPEREHFLEERWLFEAITETYLPLLDLFDHLLLDGVAVRMTMSLTPTLMAMLRDPLLMGKYERHLERMCDLARKEVARTRRDPDFGPVAGFYRDRLERMRFLFLRPYGRDLVREFVRLERAGILELIGCAATHGFLPHLAHVPETVSAQIAAGVAEHRRQTGSAPRGLWLPECATYEGLESVLARQQIEYYFVDAHAVENASSRPRFGVHAPLQGPAGVAAFGRDEECSAQVWSSEHGYPGNPLYRDFYRDIGFDLDHAYVAPFLDPSGIRGMTGFKYHRITGRTDDKRPYRRDAALRAADRDSEDFVSNRMAQITYLAARMDSTPLVVAMYDAELFGHWWFEGPEWLEGVLRKLPARGIRAMSPGQYLEEHLVGQVAEPSPSSWGEGGYYDVWLNPANDWIQPPLQDAGRRMVALASRFTSPTTVERRALAQAGRELLLAQASDWPFILHKRTSVEYARRRVHEHLGRFDRLAGELERGAVDEPELSRLEAQDAIFPEIDPGLWRSA